MSKVKAAAANKDNNQFNRKETRERGYKRQQQRMI